jgi:single-stranded DNA-binding protein
MSKEETGEQGPEPDEGKDSLYINEVTLTGHCDEAPKAVKTANGTPRAAFGMTIPQGRGNTFVRVVAWDKLAAQCALARKGGLLRIGGQLRSWRLKKEGAPMQLEVVANEVQVLDAARQRELAGV